MCCKTYRIKLACIHASGYAFQTTRTLHQIMTIISQPLVLYTTLPGLYGKVLHWGISKRTLSVGFSNCQVQRCIIKPFEDLLNSIPLPFQLLIHEKGNDWLQYHSLFSFFWRTYSYTVTMNFRDLTINPHNTKNYTYSSTDVWWFQDSQCFTLTVLDSTVCMYTCYTICMYVYTCYTMYVCTLAIQYSWNACIVKWFLHCVLEHNIHHFW